MKLFNNLFAYHFKCTARVFLPLILGVLLLAGFTKGMESLAGPLPFLTALYTFLLIISAFCTIGMFLCIILLSIRHFFRNMTSAHGYFLFMLPVKPSMHLSSHLFTYIIWLIFAGAAAVGCVFLLIPNNAYAQLGTILDQVFAVLQIGENRMITLMIVMVLLSATAFMCTVYAAISIGQLAKEKRAVTSFAAYIGIYMIEQLLSVCMLIVLFSIFGMDLFTSTAVLAENMLLSVMIGSSVLYVLIGTTSFLVANRLFSKHLNLI